jgi:hypothetical protein
MLSAIVSSVTLQSDIMLSLIGQSAISFFILGIIDVVELCIIMRSVVKLIVIILIVVAPLTTPPFDK